MNNYRLSQEEATKNQDIDPLAILFFFLGALHIYSFFKRKNRENLTINKRMTLNSYLKIAFLASILAAIIELNFF
jgi:hypothetical protein